jgi:hypothetical protein
MKNTLLVLGGAVVGGLVGCWAFGWALAQGFYALILPGGLLGLGAGLARNRSLVLAVVCGLLATALGVFAEWHYRPWVKDDSLSYFLLNFHKNDSLTLLMIAIGGVLGFWGPYSQIPKGPRPVAAPKNEAAEPEQESANT